MTSDAALAVKSIDDIAGWFPKIDQHMFEHFLSPEAIVPRGDLVELGVYLGKSAAFIGRFARENEVFTVCDLFGHPAGDGSNSQENAKSYATLDRATFERNYLALFPQLPVIVQDLSSTIVDRVAAGSVRFLHVDASHLYDQVAVDVDSARKLLLADGVVVFDDFRSNHTPGVSAAVWEAVFTKGLKPICLTEQKLYGTFGDRTAHQECLRDWLDRSDHLWWETQLIAGAPVIRVGAKPVPKPVPKQEAPKQEVPKQEVPKPPEQPVNVERLRTRIGVLEKKVAQLEAQSADRTTARTRILRRAKRKFKRVVRRDPHAGTPTSPPSRAG